MHLPSLLSLLNLPLSTSAPLLPVHVPLLLDQALPDDTALSSSYRARLRELRDLPTEHRRAATCVATLCHAVLAEIAGYNDPLMRVAGDCLALAALLDHSELLAALDAQSPPEVVTLAPVTIYVDLAEQCARTHQHRLSCPGGDSCPAVQLLPLLRLRLVELARLRRDGEENAASPIPAPSPSGRGLPS